MRQWADCYRDSWRGLITPAAFAHPAKFSRSLVERLLLHLACRKYIKPGDVIGDPFGGIGTGGILAAYHGYRWIGMELEEKFVGLANDNFAEHRTRWEKLNVPQPKIILGDSRKFDRAIDAVLTSPPYVSGGHHTDVMEGGNRNRGGMETVSVAGNHECRYDSESEDARCPHCGLTSGEAVKYFESRAKAIITSPPYSGSLDDGGPEKAHPDGYVRTNNWSGYGKSDGQIGKLKSGDVDAVVSSPPFLGARSDTTNSSGGISRDGYAESDYPSDKRIGERTYRVGAGAERDPDNIEALAPGEVDSIVSSPPYETIAAGAGGLNTKPPKHPGQQSGRAAGASQTANQKYGESEGQIAQLKKGDVAAVVSSPPYEDSVNSKSHGIDFSKAKPDYKGRVNHAERNARHAAAADNMIYGDTAGQIGATTGQTYWQAMAEVYLACFRSLKPGGVMALVVKDFVKDKKRMPLCDDTMRLLIWCGFKEVDRIRAMLVETELKRDLFEGEVVTKTERKSFFRRLHESKLAPDDPRRIDWEEVLIVQKPSRGHVGELVLAT